ncbi:MAG: prephenate dehydrogenase/arogenate dehydrogenase family protein [Firmicutes bacterium]|nr:prephenate dehydrogenase/arogenate dehydrogenase family protein [Bacillota bacterium]MBO2520462.1 prephenate dehydrogenase/arogenate dehydrogenase family protein [Bacillota bacterium]
MRSKPRVSIVGVGLIGGSLGMAWKAAGAVSEVVGVARRAETIDEALALGAIDRGTLDLEEGVREADVVILAPPVRSIVPVYRALQPYLKPGAVVSDVGSTKGEICRAIWSSGGEERFVGGHPMAGSERDGVRAADPYLFENAPYILVPHERAAQDAVDLLAELVQAAGARPLLMNPDVHDAIVATVSHIPHLLAAALVRLAAERAGEIPGVLELAAGGFRDTTRVASGPEAVWTDICMTNVSQIVQGLERFEALLRSLRETLARRDEAGLKEMLAFSRQVREKLPAKSKGILSTVHEIVVHVVDRPGAIHEVTGVLAGAGINIIDIEILRVREGEGGTLRLGFERWADREQAARLLTREGYRVWSRS